MHIGSRTKSSYFTRVNIGSSIKISLSRDITAPMNIGSGRKSSYFTSLNIGSSKKIR